MKHVASRWLALIMALALALASNAAGLALPLATIKSFSFDVGLAGDVDKFTFTVTASGCILAQITSWSRSGTSGSAASQLKLVLNGSDRTAAYAQKEGSASSIVPLWASYSVTPTEVSRVKTWTISVSNNTKSGTAKGTINLEYPSTNVPCELTATASRTKGRVDLSWRYTGKSFRGFFLVERSTDGRTWGVVTVCQKSPSSSTSYACSDTGLTSGKTYYYRACAITSGSKCGTTNLTPAISVKTL